MSGCLSLIRPTPLSTSQPSSCLSSSSPSSSSATSSSRSSTRRSWKSCATLLTTGVRAPTTSSTSPQQKWKRHQDTVYSVEKKLAQRKGLKFYQTRCNAIILYDTPPAYCMSLEAAKIPNESNHNQKNNYQERRDPQVGKSPPRRSRRVPCLITSTSSTQQERGDP